MIADGPSRFGRGSPRRNRFLPKGEKRPRRKPYTERGIARVPCAKCGAPSKFQWQICADGNRYRGLCAAHDVELNRLVMRWAFGNSREADLRSYAQRAQ